MLPRLIKLNKNNSVPLFGPRGSGKSTLAHDFLEGKNCLKINLLKSSDERRFSQNPDELFNILKEKNYDWVLIDEIQKIPKLLDLVHLAIEELKCKFFLTGSSARKLKRNSANLLAGRAFTYQLHPLSTLELENKFNLNEVLHFGSLPKLLESNDKSEKTQFLNSYARTYLTEEILMEQAVRNVDLFKDFLGIAAQCNGKILNYSKIAREIHSTDKTVKEYFQILIDTLIGIKLPAFHRSLRKSQKMAPKFYLFDTGVKRALERTLNVPLIEKTSAYGEAFEHWVILEVFRLNDYFMKDYKFSFLQTDNTEVDLVVERPGQADLLIEIKSSHQVNSEHLRTLSSFAKNWDRDVEGQLWSQDTFSKVESGIHCLNWKEGLKKLYT